MSDNFFTRMNRKQKREFESLPEEEKRQIVSAEINKTVMDTMQNEIVKSFLRGVIEGHKLLNDNQVTKIDEADTPEEFQKAIIGLVKEIKRVSGLEIDDKGNIIDSDEEDHENDKNEEN